jgi:hypothetical protein
LILWEKKELKKVAPQSVTIMNGKPIVAVEENKNVMTIMMGMEDYVLFASAEQMMDLLDLKWKS